MKSLVELFPDSDFRHHLTLRKGDPREFFASSDSSGEELKERRQWLAADRSRYSAVVPEGEPLIREFAELCSEWNLWPQSTLPPSAAEVEATLLELGTALEPDLLFLSARADGQFVLWAGVLCFPTGWALEEKIGQPLDVIHGVVPQLNRELGDAINQFLAKLRPGFAFLRDNWGISSSPERNQHPSRGVPAPRLPVDLSKLWLRVEHQALMRLPGSAGVIFAIRVRSHRIDKITADPAVASRLARALATMPSAMRNYKRLEAIADPLSREVRLMVK